MKSNFNIKSRIPDKPENPFRVPPGYFESLQNRVMDSVRSEETVKLGKPIRTIRLRTYLAIAASFAGLAIVTTILLQNILHSTSSDNDYYDMALLEKNGILQDEYAMAETYMKEEDDNDFYWEEEAITYLASNEVDLAYMLESNQ